MARYAPVGPIAELLELFLISMKLLGHFGELTLYNP